ncbi:transglutaminase domain-containing protein [Paenibacillus sp. YPG26]|uniref:DUF4129 domain-containing transglutaminase family protein n=1 Tax=Paenibacillus sp. YPG26 TaxID=2878915 RepID=UPI002041550D|nr:transglutaminase domain-containing protein [Paenibacillus sp. YPG26]USB34403.1 transglutaminase domain-containing protein [Paenibacillus sp. YPG26]
MFNRLGKVQYSWYFILCIIWVMIMSVQWIHFVKPIWYNETSVLVLYVLIASAAAEALLPFNRWLKWGVKVAAIVIIHYWVLSSYSVFVADGPLIPGNVIKFLKSLDPYIWFSLPAWGLFELAIRLASYRGFILLFTGMNIITFAILDSFTSYYLWPQVAWTVFAGLGWLVSFHFHRYQIKYPRGWSHLRLYPFKVLANVVVVFCCVLLLGVSMPEVSPVLTDPYSAWLKSRENKYGKAEEADKKEGQSASGYSRDDSKLGGGFTFDYSYVMSVTSSKAAYWRGETRDLYTGTGWALHEGHANDSSNILDQSVHDNRLGKKVKTEPVVQTVVMTGKRSYPVLFGAYSISKITLLNKEEKAKGPIARWHPGDSSVTWEGFDKNPKSAGYPSIYQVKSEIPIIPLRELRSSDYDSLYPDGVEDKYLQLNPDFPDSVRELAERVTAKGKTPYEKMVLLQNYLKTNYTYTNTPDLSRKVHEDLVEGFLFDIKAGYCDYFSTSMVTMARSVGMPARWVKGFSTGHQQFQGPENLTSVPTGPYVVTNADAHSWAEVYFGEDYGWVTFEATPGFDAPMNVADDELNNTLSKPVTAEPEDMDSEEESARSANRVFIHTFLWIAAGVLFIVGGFLVWKYRSTLYYAYLRLRQGRELTSGEKVVVETGRWLSFMKRRGFTREDHETLREAIARWKGNAPDMAASFDELLLQFEKAKYSPHAVTEQDWRALQGLLHNMSRSLKKTYSH